MWNSGKKFRALRNKKINILTLVLSEFFFLNESKKHNPPPPPPPFKLNGRSLKYVTHKFTMYVFGQKIYNLFVRDLESCIL